MRKLKFILFILAAAVLRSPALDYAVIPSPVKYVAEDGIYNLPQVLKISVPEGSENSSRLLNAVAVSGLEVVESGKDGDIIMSLNAGMAPEEYNLDITPRGITIEGGSDRGLYNGIQTVLQIIAKSDDGILKSCHISDYPRFGYRSMMLDATRYFIPKDEILRLIDQAAALKLNNVHLHLTDDNGWRLEIKKYPKLTEVGAWRVNRSDYFPGRLNPTDPAEPTTIGGFYTQDEMREIVAYAADRFINIIPEIEMPAHSAAAIASYPELACPVTEKFIGVFPGIGGKDASIIMCAGNELVYQFYQDVLDEVMDIFPSQYIHLGGDEAEKSHWKKCPLCQKRIEEEGLDNFEELQAYFMDRINHYVRSKGRTAMGWDEVTYGDPKEDMIILGWQGTGNVAVNDARKSGRKFILTPAKCLYLIRYQGPQWFEPFTYFGNSTLSDVYHFEPVKEDWSPELKNQLLGIQGSLWTEFCNNPQDVEYLVFPRLVAVADVAWRPEGERDWKGFLKALDDYLPQLEKSGINYAKSMYNIQHTAVPDGEAVNVTLECIRPDVAIKYATPSGISSYSTPLKVDSPTKISAYTVKDGEERGKKLDLNFNFNKATAKNVDASTSSNGLGYTLTNGLRGSHKTSDFEWAGWHNRDAEFTVDLGSVQPLNSIKLGTVAHTDICIAAPEKISVYVSNDGENFTHLKTVSLPHEMVFAKKAHIYNVNLGNFDTEARYVKFAAVNPGNIPSGFARDGAATWMYFDEIMID